MYWIYILIFIVAIMIPQIIGDRFLMIEGEKAESILLMLLGIISFLIFFFVEKQHTKDIKEKSEIQKEASSIFKDLKHSYAYIGEINRKLDILKNLAVTIPEKIKNGKKNDKQIYQHLMQAISAIGKSNDYLIRFVARQNLKTIKEIKTSKQANWKIDNENQWFVDKFVHELEKFTVFCSPKEVGGVKACIIIQKRKNQLAEDIEMLKILAYYALVLFDAEQEANKVDSRV
jgi:hypothetical protein